MRDRDTEDLPRGAIVGAATLTNVYSDQWWQRSYYQKIGKGVSPWFEGPYGFEMADAVEFAEPIPCRGQLGIRDISDALAARVSKMISEARRCN